MDNETLLAEIACMLIEAGANVNQIDKDHFTPLIYGMRYNCPSFFFLNRFFIIAAYHNRPSIALVLLESNSLINQSDKQGWTALHWAIDRDHSDVVQLLIDKGAQIDLRSHRGELAISRAKSIRVKDIVKHIKRYSTISLSLTDTNLSFNNLKKYPSNFSMIHIDNLQSSKEM